MATADHITLRDYQQKGADDIRAAYRAGFRRPLFESPTGSGKTVLFSYIARNAAKRGNRVAILVHRRELVRQTCEKLEHEHGVIASGRTRSQHPIQVASVQTLVRRTHLYNFDLIVVDEAHHATASTYLKIIEANPKARVLGVTATPCRQTGKGLGDLFDVLIPGPSVQELTDRGYLAPAVVYAPSTPDVSGVHTARGDYVKRELETAVDKPTLTGDAIAHYRKYAHKKPAIAFCVSVAHAEHFAAQATQAGYRARAVSGKTPQAERDWAIAALGCDELDIVASCDLISEGVDVPVVACGIMLRPTKSTGLAIQQIGRVLRAAPGKTEAVILDHAGNCLRHGLPSTPREWSLDSGLVVKKSNANPTDAVRQCGKCYYCHRPAPRCPACGYLYPPKPREIEEVDGELQRIEAVRVALAKRREEGQAQTFEDLKRLGKERGYKPGWAYQRWQARQRKRRAQVCTG